MYEYHHKLCPDNGNYTYLDEFVAHRKQWQIVKPAASDVERVREVNERSRLLYGSKVDRWLAPKTEYGMGCRLVERLSDVGDFLVPDNAQAKPTSQNAHACEMVVV